MTSTSPKNNQGTVKASNMKTISFEFKHKKTINVEISSESQSFETCGNLFKKIIAALQKMSSGKNTPIDVSNIVALQTKTTDIVTDYLLSLEDRNLNFLKDGTVLVPYYGTKSASSSSCVVHISDYEFLAKIGEGGFATVYLARLKQTGKFYAIKQIEKAQFSDRERTNLLRERNSMVELRDPFVIHLHTAFQTEDHCYLVMDYVIGGDLLSHLEVRRRFSEEQTKFYVAEIALGLKNLHERNILYRDLKSENVMIDLDGHVNLGDFGLSKKVQDSNELNFSVCGTPQFIAPEVYKQTGYTCVADYHALGVLAFEMATGVLPFIAHDIPSLARKIKNDSPTVPCHFTSEFQDFISRLLEKDPSKRLGAHGGFQEIISHAWFRTMKYDSLIQRKLKAPIVPDLTRIRLRPLAKDFNPEQPKDIFLLDLTKAQTVNENRRLDCFSYYSDLHDLKVDGVVQESKTKSADFATLGSHLMDHEITDCEDDTLESSLPVKPSHYVFNNKLKCLSHIIA